MNQKLLHTLIGETIVNSYLNSYFLTTYAEYYYQNISKEFVRYTVQWVTKLY